MVLRQFSDIQTAFDAGRHWTVPFSKNTGITLSNTWIDNSFSGGRPGYNSHTGTGAPLQWFPAVAQRNQSIWIPPVPAGMTRHLASMTLYGTNGGGPDQNIIFDLLGYYSGIDGDSIDIQTLDNSTWSGLPRYGTGAGVNMVLVSNVAPNAVNGSCVITYIDDKGVSQTTPTFNIKFTNALGTICSGNVASASSTVGPISIPLASGSTGVQQVTSVQFQTAPSGQYALYLFKTLATVITNWDSTGTTATFPAIEKDFCIHNAFSMPVIYDGAWLGQFSYHTGGNSNAWYGDYTFVWG